MAHLPPDHLYSARREASHLFMDGGNPMTIYDADHELQATVQAASAFTPESTTETNGRRDGRHDSQIIADLRYWRNTVGARKDQTTIGTEELDALLAAVDERDALKRSGTDDDATPDMLERRAIIADYEKTTSLDGRSSWPISPPTLLPFCDCGSVDKYGDDLGEHGPRCPYHLAVLRFAPSLSARELDDLCMRTLRAMSVIS